MYLFLLQHMLFSVVKQSQLLSRHVVELALPRVRCGNGKAGFKLVSQLGSTESAALASRRMLPIVYVAEEQKPLAFSTEVRENFKSRQ